jgi:TonB family protein
MTEQTPIHKYSLKLPIMKKFLLVILCLAISGLTYSQNEKGRTTLEEVEVSPPEFVGVHNATIFLSEKTAHSSLLMNYIKNQVEYPEIDIKHTNEGKEIVRFTVNPDGSLANFKVVNSVSPSIDEEVIDALKTTNGMWKPGYNNETIVPMEKEFSLVFKIMETNDLMTRATVQFKRGNKLLLIKEKPQRALQHFDQGLVYVPESKPLLFLRGLSRYELGDKNGAYQDWKRVKSLGGIEADGWLENYSEMEGYAEMMKIMNE